MSNSKWCRGVHFNISYNNSVGANGMGNVIKINSRVGHYIYYYVGIKLIFFNFFIYNIKLIYFFIILKDYLRFIIYVHG